MANPIINSPPPPLTKDDLEDCTNVFPVPPDILQLQVDTLNVLQALVPITNFSPEYQERIKDYYKYSADYQLSNMPKIAKRTFDTLDII